MDATDTGELNNRIVSHPPFLHVVRDLREDRAYA